MSPLSFYEIGRQWFRANETCVIEVTLYAFHVQQQHEIIAVQQFCIRRTLNHDASTININENRLYCRMKEFKTMNEAIVGMHITHAQRTKNYDSTNAHFVCSTLDLGLWIECRYVTFSI